MYKYLLIIIFLNGFYCSEKERQKKEFLPLENLFSQNQINKVLKSDSGKKSLSILATKKGFTSYDLFYRAVERDISEEELNYYYRKFKRNISEEEGIEAVSLERDRVRRSIAWTKIFLASGIEPDEDELPRLDWKFLTTKDEVNFGSPGAKVTVFEFSDFECGFCIKSQEINRQLRENFKGKIHWVFKDFPLTDEHSDALDAHISLGCVMKSQPEKTTIYFNTVFDGRGKLSSSSLRTYAQSSGVDLEKFESCLSDEKMMREILNEINHDIQEGKKLTVKGTPVFLVNGILVRGMRTYEYMERLINLELLRK